MLYKILMITHLTFSAGVLYWLSYRIIKDGIATMVAHRIIKD
jgi:hypothetical protein